MLEGLTNCAFHFFFSCYYGNRKKNNSKRGQLFGPLSISAINQRSCVAAAVSFVFDCSVPSADEASPCSRHLVSGTAPHERQMIGLYPPCSLSLSLSLFLSLSLIRSLARSLSLFLCLCLCLCLSLSLSDCVSVYLLCVCLV